MAHEGSAVRPCARTPCPSTQAFSRACRSVQGVACRALHPPHSQRPCTAPAPQPEALAPLGLPRAQPSLLSPPTASTSLGPFARSTPAGATGVRRSQRGEGLNPFPQIPSLSDGGRSSEGWTGGLVGSAVEWPRLSPTEADQGLYGSRPVRIKACTDQGLYGSRPSRCMSVLDTGPRPNPSVGMLSPAGVAGSYAEYGIF
jgi:hypothetical protein